MIRVTFEVCCDHCPAVFTPVIPRRRDRHQEEALRMAALAGWGWSRTGDWWYCPECVPILREQGASIKKEDE